jgi:hypothetical protein
MGLFRRLNIGDPALGVKQRQPHGFVWTTDMVKGESTDILDGWDQNRPNAFQWR